MKNEILTYHLERIFFLSKFSNKSLFLQTPNLHVARNLLNGFKHKTYTKHIYTDPKIKS